MFFGQSRTYFSGRTLAQRLDDTQGRPSGFDYMRVLLALGVIYSHSTFLSYGDKGGGGDMFDYIRGSLIILIVPMFFALSGFLVAGSLERSKSLITFLGLRVFRILPALAMEVLLSALILGPLLTTLPLSEYFSQPQFYTYFLNILGDIHYHLPGVFQSNPNQLVNGQLWTVPYELVCYVALSALAIVGIFKRREWLLVSLVIYYAAQVGNTLLRPNYAMKVAGGSTVVMAFIVGIILYRYREKIIWSFWAFTAMAVLSCAIVMIPNGTRFVALPVAYITVYLGLLNPARNKILLSGDYSYGLYLYGYPIQQAIVAPEGLNIRDWRLNLLLGIPCAALIAAGSWWLVEKPVLNRRGILKKLEDWYFLKRSKT